VRVKTMKRALWFVLLFVPAGRSVASQISAEPVRLTVSVHNDANVPLDTMTAAEITASRIFRLAGLVVTWVVCSPAPETKSESTSCTEAEFPSHLQVRIMSQPRNATSATFGIAYLAADGTGCYSDIFFSRIIHWQSSSGQNIGPILGYVMAHEIAHLLLGRNSHSQFGIMRSQWQKEELRKAAQGGLLFTVQESQRMRQRLAAARQAAAD
jgi:hypothetical protein